MVKAHEYHTNTDRPQTAKKLSILRKYFSVWLEIWSGPRCAGWVGKNWYVLDLFAGTGESNGADGNTISGSPLVFLEEISRKADRLNAIGSHITLVLVEQDPPSFAELNRRIGDYLSAHPEVAAITTLEMRCEDCNFAVGDFVAKTKVDGKTPAFVFVDPYGLAIQHASMDMLMTLPWAVDILFNYMLDGIKRTFGAAIGTSSRAESNASTIAAYFGEGVTLTGQMDVENPKIYARATFCAHGLRAVAFFMKSPTKDSIQYILLFASKKPRVVDIMRSIYAREMKDLYGQLTIFDTEDYLALIEVIEP